MKFSQLVSSARKLFSIPITNEHSSPPKPTSHLPISPLAIHCVIKPTKKDTPSIYTPSQKANLEPHDFLMPLHSKNRSREFDRHSRIQDPFKWPLLRLDKPLLTIKNFSFLICAVEVFLNPSQSCHFVVCTRTGPVVFEMASEFISRKCVS